MKIIAGSLGGRLIKQPPRSVSRPLTEKVRAAIFDVLGAVAQMIVLDAYAGSGAAGFEAISRGALLVESIEANGKAARVIADNAQSLGLDWGYAFHQMTVETWLASPNQQPPQARYDLILADPPYSKLDAEVLDRLGAYLQPSGILVVSHSNRLRPPQLSLPLAKQKTYGDSALSFYKR